MDKWELETYEAKEAKCRISVQSHSFELATIIILSFLNFLTMMARKKLSTEQLQLLTLHPFQFLEFRCYTYACMHSNILLFSRLSLYCEGILVCKLKHCLKITCSNIHQLLASTMNPSSNIAIEEVQCCFAKFKFIDHMCMHE